MGKMLYCAAEGLFPVFCAISSAVERYLHTVDVIGSIPISHIEAGDESFRLFLPPIKIVATDFYFTIYLGETHLPSGVPLPAIRSVF